MPAPSAAAARADVAGVGWRRAGGRSGGAASVYGGRCRDGQVGETECEVVVAGKHYSAHVVPRGGDSRELGAAGIPPPAPGDEGGGVRLEGAAGDEGGCRAAGLLLVFATGCERGVCDTAHERRVHGWGGARSVSGSFDLKHNVPHLAGFRRKDGENRPVGAANHGALVRMNVWCLFLGRLTQSFQFPVGAPYASRRRC